MSLDPGCGSPFAASALGGSGSGLFVGEVLGAVRRAVRTDGSLEVTGWSEGDSDAELWIEQDDARGMVYVDLEANPERFTG